MTGRLLIAGVGNVFLGDDGFGVEVAARLATADLPDFADVADYGIRGMHLAYDLANGYDSAILVDAMARGGVPGTLYVIEPDMPVPISRAGADGMADGTPVLDAHGMQPDAVLSMLGTLGAADRQILVVGCEPASVGYGIGLSEPVAAAVSPAVAVVLDLVADAGQSEDHRLIAKEWAHVPGDPR